MIEFVVADEHVVLASREWATRRIAVKGGYVFFDTLETYYIWASK